MMKIKEVLECARHGQNDRKSTGKNMSNKSKKSYIKLKVLVPN